ncbi:MAG: DUF4334 domain-containing protein [Mycobacterium sp.]
MSDARRRFNEFKERTGSITYADLDEFWSTLETVTIEFMIGEWTGGDLPTGHRGDSFLGNSWYGTTFRSASDVDPVVCVDENGDKFSDTKLMKGAASLWMEEFRGEVTATMVYDGVPIHDHFKKVDDNAVIAITNGKGALDRGRHFYFYLERL